MKNALILVLTVSALALGAVCFVQYRQTARHKSQAVAMREVVAQQTRQIAELEQSQKLLQRQQQESFEQASELATRLQAHQQAKTSNAGGEKGSLGESSSEAAGAKPMKNKNPFGEMLAKMMEDPDTRKAIQEQQRMVLDQLYAPLVKQMQLSPDEAEHFKDLLSENMLKGAEKATSLFGGTTSTNRAEMFSSLAEEQKSSDEQIKAFLGEDRYEQYKDYQLTVGERTQLNQFRQQTTGENALTDQQAEQLLSFMKEEKQNMVSAGGLPGPTPDAANLQAMFSGESAEKMFQSQETVNQRVYDRAKSVLSPNQLASFGRFQTNQFQMMRMGMNMARKFMEDGESSK